MPLTPSGILPRLRALESPQAFTLLELLLVLAVLAMLSSIALPRVERMLAKAEHRAAADGLHAALSQLRLKAIQAGRTHSFRYIPGSGIIELRAESADEVRQIDFLADDNPAGGMIDQGLEQPAQDGSQDSREGRARLADWTGVDTLTRPVEDSGELSMGSDSMAGDQVERSQLTGDMLLVSSLEEGLATEGELANDGKPMLLGNRELRGNRRNIQEDNLAGELSDVSPMDDSTAAQWSAPILFYPDGRASDARLFVVAPTGYVIELAVVGITGKVHVGNRRRLPEGALQLNLLPNVQPELAEE